VVYKNLPSLFLNLNSIYCYNDTDRLSWHTPFDPHVHYSHQMCQKIFEIFGYIWVTSKWF